MIEGESNLQKIRGLSKADAELYACYRALLLLALGKAAQAHEILNSIESVQLRDTAVAFDSVAVTRLGRQPEAVVMLNEATRTFGETQYLRAAKAYIESGIGTFRISGKAYPSDPGLTTCWVCGCHRRNVRSMFCDAQPLEVRPPDVPRRLRGALSR